MNAEIINIGDELLLGQTIDTNSVYIAKRLNEFGINISRKYCISDNENEILECLENSMSRTDLVIITGGLGPTKDDITKSTLAKFFKSDWRIDQDVLNHLEVIFKNRHRELLEFNKLQANLPSNSTTLFNKAGTAPGMMFQIEDKIVISLPGVPNEVEEIIENSFIPFIKTKYNIPQQKRRTLITLLEPESKLSQLLNDFETKYSKTYPLSYLPSYNMVKIRLNQNLNNSNGDEFEEVFNELLGVLGDKVLCVGDITPAEYLASVLQEKNLKISFAESCTGGFICNQFVQIPGISTILEGGMTTYSNDFKVNRLLIDPDLFNINGAVSAEVAEAMVNQITKLSKTDIGISTTGIAGPTGEVENKPIGTIFIGTKVHENTVVKQYLLRGNRQQFMERALNCALYQLNQQLMAIKS
jgi:nicotinamide-nucleotide amidase